MNPVKVAIRVGAVLGMLVIVTPIILALLSAASDIAVIIGVLGVIVGSYATITQFDKIINWFADVD